MIKVEGLRSYKGIAFIRSKSNPRTARLKAKIYSTLRRSLQRAQIFSKNTFSARKTREYFNKKLGDEKWIE